MEIERQFLIEKFPELPEIYAAQVWQGYLSTAPVVRIRRFSPPDGCDRYELTVKGKGTMVRAEVNIPIDAAQYEEMSGILRREPIHKDYHVYELPDGLRLECSAVDPETELPAFLSALDAAGMQAYLDEANAQLDAYLAK